MRFTSAALLVSLALVVARRAEATPKAYVVVGPSGSKSLQVIDTNTDQVVQTLSIPGGFGVAAHPLDTVVYVSDNESGNIYFENTDPTGPKGTSSPAGNDARGIAWDNRFNRLFTLEKDISKYITGAGCPPQHWQAVHRQEGLARRR